MSFPKIASVMLALACAGCSTLRPDLSPDRLALGTTTKAEVLQSFGLPGGMDTISGPEIPVLTTLFRYGVTKGRAPEVFRGAWEIPQRNLFLEFVNDTLHGFLYNNSADKHTTNFDKHLRWKIPIGLATRENVLALLGEPSGKMLMPTGLLGDPGLTLLRHEMPARATDVWCFYYGYPYFKEGVRKRLEFYRFLAVYFDARGVVVDKYFTESDKTEPSAVPIYSH